MKKQDLIEHVSAETGMPKAHVKSVIESTFDLITKDLSEGNSLTMPGFGTFTTKARSARTGRNPQTGEAIEIQASINPAFKPSKALKEAVNS